MSLPPALIRFLTRINRNGPVAWTVIGAMTSFWIFAALVNPAERPRPSPTLVPVVLFLGGIAGYLIKKILVWSGRFEPSEPGR